MSPRIPGTLDEPETPPAIVPPAVPPEPVTPPADPAPPADRRHQHPPEVTCRFCECVVTTTRGEVLRFSNRARELRDTAETIDRYKAEIDTLKTQIAELRSRLPQPPAPGSPSGGSRSWSGSA